MTLETLEEEKEELLLELRELLSKRDENQLRYSEDGIPTPKVERDRLNKEINEVKLELTEAENALRRAKRDGRMRFSEALASICLREGHGNWIEEAKRVSGSEP